MQNKKRLFDILDTEEKQMIESEANKSMLPLSKYTQQSKNSSNKLNSESYEVTPRSKNETGAEGNVMYPSIANLKTKFDKQKSPDYRNDDYVGVQTLNEREKEPLTQYQQTAWKMSCMSLENIFRSKRRAELLEGYKKIRDMNSLCREYRSQMLLSLTKVFSVLKHKQTLQKSQAFHAISRTGVNSKYN